MKGVGFNDDLGELDGVKGSYRAGASHSNWGTAGRDSN